MNTRELYQALNRSIKGINSDLPLPKSFNTLKHTSEFRWILRTVGAASIEQQLYGNNKVALMGIEQIQQNVIFNFFERINKRYQYWKIDRKDYKNDQALVDFQWLYYIVQMTLLSQNKDYSVYNQFKLAYQILVLYGRPGHDIEDVLQHLDLLCRQHDNSLDLTAIVIGNLRELNRSIQLEDWQKIIANSFLGEDFILFNQAMEIEKFLGRAPFDFFEAKFISTLLVANKEWSIDEYKKFLPKINSEQGQVNFIASLTEKNISELSKCPYLLIELLRLMTNPIVQNELLIRLPNKLLKDINGLWYADIFAALSVDNISYLIDQLSLQHMIDPAISMSFGLTKLINKFPSHFDKLTFLKKISVHQEYKDLLLGSHALINDFLPLLKPEQRLNFLFDVVGKDKLMALVMKDNYYFSRIYNLLPTEECFQLIQQLPIDQLKKLQKDHDAWHQLKSNLNPDDKNKLNQLVYSAEDLKAKVILKNIKTSIQNTDWSSSWQTSTSNRLFGKKYVNTHGGAVDKQIDEFCHQRNRSKTPVAALNEIKRIGQAEAAKNASSTGFFSSKGNTEKYFDQFAGEETFNKAFGVRKS
jgi:hypothetical protein